MKYMGSKSRIAKHILPIILEERRGGQWYVEPFCGGCNVIDKVDGDRLANDLNGYIIEAFKALQAGWIPPKSISKNDYDKLRESYYSGSTENAHIIGYVGVCGSYNGRFFDGGYAGIVGIKNGKFRDYPAEAFANVIEQSKLLGGIVFESKSYDELDIPDASIIYCDPPYKGSKQYRNSKAFDHDCFYAWCREKKSQGHTVFVSEYSMPDDFVCVWSKEQTSSMTLDTGSKRATERLFKL